MTNDLTKRATDAADDVFERGSRPEDIDAALAQVGNARKVFFDRLAVRAMLHANIVSETGEAPAAMVAAAISTLQSKTHPNTAGADLGDPKTWLAAKAAFGNDVPFIMKLFGRQVTIPTNRFMRDAADALGVAIDRVRDHFVTSGPPLAAGIERKASGRQIGPSVESFQQAVASANLPAETKNRWLSE